MTEITRICLLGFGEVGSLLADALNDLNNVTLVAFDTGFSDPGSKASMRVADRPFVRAVTSPKFAVADAQMVISAVTAGQAFEAAAAVASSLPKACWYLDVNSVSPATKCRMADLVCSASGRFVEAAIMSPIHPKGIQSPIFLAGPFAQQFESLALELGFSGCRYFSEESGQAAATKMCRSVMIKGLESLLAESLITARHYGVEHEVLASLNNLMPGVDWNVHAAYMISRSLEHGVRRAEEMREVAKTIADAGVLSGMSSACAESQQWVANFSTVLMMSAQDNNKNYRLHSILDNILSIVQQGSELEKEI